MHHANYYADEFRGQTVYRCMSCKHDTFNEDNAIGHQADAKHNHIVLPDWKDTYGWKFPQSREAIVVIGILSSASDLPTRSVDIAIQEVDRLRDKGIDAYCCWVHNGTASDVPNPPYPDYVRLLGSNKGQSVARNLILDYAVEAGADILVMVDGDIELIPYSAAALSEYLLVRPPGCVGLYSHNCTAVRDTSISTHCLSVEGLTSLDGAIAWTQYGAFSVDMFRDGIRFDESDCFQGPGWGFEDDDLYCQMMVKGYQSANTRIFRYGHFRKHSSLRAMDPALAAKVYNERKSYVFNKWRDNLATAAHIMRLVNQNIPLLDY